MLVVALLSGLLMWSGLVGLPGPAAHAAGPLVTGRWQVAPTPSAPTGWSMLESVACASATQCIAVGSRLTAEGTWRPLAQRRDGSAWTTMQMPAEDGETLSGVSCGSATFCVAVGAVADMYAWPVAARWDGHAWSTVTGLSDDVGGLSAVSCVSARFCAAVGTTGQDFDPLMQTWDGTRWRAESFGTWPEDELAGVSCASATSCMAVGHSGSNQNSMIALHWNGRSWHWQKLPKLPGDVGLTAVACPSTRRCVAVGGDQRGRNTSAAILTWTGKRWHGRVLPAWLRGDALTGISCRSATQCLVAGWPALVLRDGAWLSTWPAQPSGSSGGVDGVDCPPTRARQCVAVGLYNRLGSDVLRTLAEVYTFPLSRRVAGAPSAS